MNVARIKVYCDYGADYGVPKFPAFYAACYGVLLGKRSTSTSICLHDNKTKQHLLTWIMRLLKTFMFCLPWGLYGNNLSKIITN